MARTDRELLTDAAALLPPGKKDEWVAVMSARQALDIFEALGKATREIVIGKEPMGWFARHGSTTCHGRSVAEALGQLATILEFT